MAGDKSITISVDDEGQYAGIQIVDKGVLGEAVLLEAVELEQVIERLGFARDRLVDRIPDELDPGAYHKRVILNPNWTILDNPQGPGKLLLVRHPGYGWLGFTVLPQVANLLAEKLKED